jgi:hypothetical protein
VATSDAFVWARSVVMADKAAMQARESSLFLIIPNVLFSSTKYVECFFKEQHYKQFLLSGKARNARRVYNLI